MEQGGVLALALAVIYVPGLLIALAMRLRGLSLASAAPGISVGLYALLAILFPWVGVRWTIWSAVVGSGIAVVLFWCAALLARQSDRVSEAAPPRGRALITAGVVIGAGLNAARLMTYVGRPDAISQTNDAVFHLNALRWIAETGSASSFDISRMVGSHSFYPGAWHAVTSLLTEGIAEAPTAVNMVSLVIVAAIWPIGIAMLARGLGVGTRVVAFTAALSSGMYAFPQLMFEWGVLYPYALSLALAPGIIGLVIAAVRSERSHGPGLIRLGVLAALSLAGIALSQPSTILLVGLMVLICLSADYLHRTPHGRLEGVILVSGWGILALVWMFFTFITGSVVWRAYRSVPGAVLDVLVNGQSLTPPSLGISILMVCGVVVSLRERRWRWLVFAWGLLSTMYVIGVATDLPLVKRILTGAWYGDSFRLAAIVPIAVIPLAAVGLAGALRLCERHLPPWRSAVLPAVSLAAIAVIGIVWTTILPVAQLRVAAETDGQSRYAMDADSYLSIDEYRLLRELPDLVPADALLLGNPSTGAAFAYSLGRRDIVPRSWNPPSSDAWALLEQKLNRAGDDPAVCEALATLGSPGYVLDFGPGGTGPGQYIMPGMTGFAGRSGFEKVADVGAVSLWKITACG